MMKKKRAFTLVEMMVTVAILVVLLGTGMAVTVRSINEQKANAAAGQLTTTMRQARSAAQSGRVDPAICAGKTFSGWQVTTSASGQTYTVSGNCSGTTYLASTVQLPDGITISPVSYTVVFKPLSQGTDILGSIPFTLSGNGTLRIVTVTNSGQITIDPTPTALPSLIPTSTSAPTPTRTPTPTMTPVVTATRTPTPTVTTVPTVAEIPSDLAYLEENGLVVMEAENYSSVVNRGGKTWSQDTSVAGFVGESSMVALPDTGTNVTSNYVTNSSEMQYKVNFESAGQRYIWIKVYGPSGSSDSMYVGVDGVADASDAVLFSKTGSWVWNKRPTSVATNFSKSGLKTINLWMREDGALVDRILITTDSSYVPSGDGPDESRQDYVSG